MDTDADLAADTTADQATDGAATDGAATDGAATDGAATEDVTGRDGADGVGAGAEEVDESATWADAVPWLALQVGSRPSAQEVAVALAMWNMLQSSPGVTALRLAADAETVGIALDPTAVSRVLTRYQRAGIVTASEDGPVTRWSPITPGAIIAGAKRDMISATTSGLSGTLRGVRATIGSGTALPAGGLRAAVAGHLAAHPGEDFSPNEIGRALGGRSSGAVSKACERLVGDRVAVRTSDRPCRYQHAENAAAATDEE